jgi:hypothetical protein
MLYTITRLVVVYSVQKWVFLIISCLVIDLQIATRRSILKHRDVCERYRFERKDRNKDYGHFIHQCYLTMHRSISPK